MQVSAETKLVGEVDANVWAKEFVRIWGHRLGEVDEALMVGWFANAIMSGYDKAQPDAELRGVRAGIEYCAVWHEAQAYAASCADDTMQGVYSARPHKDAARHLRALDPESVEVPK